MLIGKRGLQKPTRVFWRLPPWVGPFGGSLDAQAATLVLFVLVAVLVFAETPLAPAIPRNHATALDPAIPNNGAPNPVHQNSRTSPADRPQGSSTQPANDSAVNGGNHRERAQEIRRLSQNRAG
jgi:hypothetical protein